MTDTRAGTDFRLGIEDAGHTDPHSPLSDDPLCAVYVVSHLHYPSRHPL